MSLISRSSPATGSPGADALSPQSIVLGVMPVPLCRWPSHTTSSHVQRRLQRSRLDCRGSWLGDGILLEDAARARQRESKLLQEHNHMCGAVYLVGYVVECKLKTLLHKRGRPYPRSGSAGHDLRGLWDAAGLRSQDLSGYKKAFLDTWTTSLRYSSTLPAGTSAEELLRGAQELASYVTSRIRHARPRNKGGRR